jgi:secreted Zn-dependent insulinase-like peptidase
VHSEFLEACDNDVNRMEAVWKSTALPTHPMRKFADGNENSLMIQNGLSGGASLTQDRILSHWRTFYSPDRMTLVVMGKECLDTLEKWVSEDFSLWTVCRCLLGREYFMTSRCGVSLCRGSLQSVPV